VVLGGWRFLNLGVRRRDSSGDTTPCRMAGDLTERTGDPARVLSVKSPAILHGVVSPDQFGLGKLFGRGGEEAVKKATGPADVRASYR